MAEVVEDHVRTHLVDPEKHPGALDEEAAEQLLDLEVLDGLADHAFVPDRIRRTPSPRQ